jgi:hypothetical protein
MAPKPLTDVDRLHAAEEIIRRKNAELASNKATIAHLHHEHDTAETIRQKIYSLAARDPEPPTWIERAGAVSGIRGVPMTVWSDWHWEEEVDADETAGMNEFTPEIAKKRVQKLVNITKELAFEHMGRTKTAYPGMVICLGGDMITGNIHEELLATNLQTPNEAIEDVTDNLCAALDNMATAFGKLFIPCVVGNHGRSTHRPRMKQRVTTSYEWNVYCNLARNFKKSKHLQFLIPNEADAFFAVHGHRYLLTHGDSLGVKGGDGIIGALGPIMRGAIKTGKSEAQIGRNFDTIVMGHWHQYLTLPGVIVNNCLIGYNEYARLGLRAPYSRPSQALWFTHPTHGITAHWQVYLEPLRKTQNSKVWVEWQK